MKRKLNVVWLCHFSNNEFKKKLKPRKNNGEFAPWIPMAIDTVKGNDEFDLTVVAAHPYISGIKKYEVEGVTYYFYNPYIPFLGYSWPLWFRWDYISNFWSIKRIVGRIINQIKPDVIHLFGAENPEYSPAILPLIGKLPIVLTVQGFSTHSAQKMDWRQKKRASVELEIIKRIPIVFYERKKQLEDIRAINPAVVPFWHTFASYEIKNPPVIPETPSFDFVFWGRIDRDKGVVDLLEAIKYIKEKYGVCFTLNMIGGLRDDEFPSIARKIGIANQVTWSGFQPTREDVFKLAVQAKITVLPTYHDVMPGTIMESMFLKIPVISYATDSIPEINENEECICLVERGNKTELANAMYSLLNNLEKRQELIDKGFKRAYEMFAPTVEELRKALMYGYQFAIDNFKNE